MNFVPFVIVGILGLLAAMLSFPPWSENGLPTWVWWAIVAAVVSFYAPVTDAIVWRLTRREREAEVAAQKFLMELRLARIEHYHGAAGRERAVELAMKEMRQHLTPAERAELDFLCADNPHRKAAE